MSSYCLKCKKATASLSPTIVNTASGRTMEKSKCSECGTNKSKFVSSLGGDGNKRIVKEALKNVSKIGSTALKDVLSELNKKAVKSIDKKTGKIEGKIEQKYKESQPKSKKLEGLKKSVEIQTFYDDQGVPYYWDPVSNQTYYGEGKKKKKM